MRNPWLDIPLQDYEGHMALPAVGQAELLAAELRRHVERLQPASIALVGCAGGNGLDGIDRAIVERVVAIDINPAYLQETRRRYSARFAQLDLHCADIQSDSIDVEPVDLVYAALIFEHVDLVSSFGAVKALCRRGGTLATLLQLPHEQQGTVTASPFESLKRLTPLMKLVDPAVLARHAIEAGFTPQDSSVLTLPSGKRFHAQTFRR